MIKKASLPWNTLRVLLACAMLLMTVANTASAQKHSEAYAAWERGDHATAARLLQPLALQGNAYAQTALGVMYTYGQGVPQDFTEALRWYRRAAEQGLADAQNNLGVMYEYGQGVLQDHAEAARWYRRAAEQGNANAQGSLGSMYFDGKGVAQDYVEAVRWIKHAAEWGHAGSQMGLGVLYASGLGVPQDYVAAHKWLNLAAARFSASENEKRDLAFSTREQVAAKMTPAQMAEAQRLAREWQPTSSDR